MARSSRSPAIAGPIVLLVVAVPLALYGVAGLRAALELERTERDRSADTMSDEEVATITTRWNAWPGLSALSRALSLRLSTDAVDAGAASGTELGRDLVGREPARTEAWLTAATAYLVDGGAKDRVEDAIRRSFATGRYEGRVLSRRLLFCLAAWPILAQDVRENAIRDLDQLQQRLKGDEYERVAVLMRLVDPQIRDQIRELVLRIDSGRLQVWFDRLAGLSQ